MHEVMRECLMTKISIPRESDRLVLLVMMLIYCPARMVLGRIQYQKT